MRKKKLANEVLLKVNIIKYLAISHRTKPNKKGKNVELKIKY